MDDHDSEALDILRRLEPALGRVDGRLRDIEDRLLRIEATLPSLATRADVASKPNRGELWGAMAGLLAVYAVILAGLAILLPIIERGR